MRRQDQSSTSKTGYNLAEVNQQEEDGIIQQENSGNNDNIIQQHNPIVADTSHSSPFDLPPAISNTSNTTTTTNKQNQDQAHSRNPFSYSTPTRNLNPQSLLSTRLRTTRSTRRTLFLDKLRSSRRDERDNSIIERFEKEEYWAERRRREEALEREAGFAGEEFWGGEEERQEEIEEEEQDEGMITPVDEEGEIGMLVEGWMGWQGRGDGDGGGVGQGEHEEPNEDDTMDGQFDFEDSDVEDVFLHVLSQEAERSRLGELNSLSYGEGPIQLHDRSDHGHGHGHGHGHSTESPGGQDGQNHRRQPGREHVEDTDMMLVLSQREMDVS